MTVGMVGADPRALREMAVQFDAAAQQLMASRGSVQVWVDRRDVWRGLDNHQFKDMWDTMGSVSVVGAAKALQRYADILRANADAQDSTSAADGAGIGGSGLFLGRHDGSTGSAVSMRAMAEEMERRLGEIDDVLKWTGHLLDTTYRTAFFEKFGGALAGFTGTWRVLDDLQHNNGGRFFEHSSSTSVALVGGIAGGVKGTAWGIAFGSVVPGPGTAIGAVVGGTIGAMVGSGVGGLVGGGLGTMMDHALRGEAAGLMAKQASVMSQPIQLPFAF
ncbi:MAG: hypothetical protein ACK4UY_05775 [Dietzia sp.]